MRILVRVDGGREIGLGNVYRGLAVADQMIRCGLTTADEVLFLVGYAPAPLGIIASYGYRAEFTGVCESLAAELTIHKRWVAAWQPDCVLVDVPEHPDRPEPFFTGLRYAPQTLLVNLSDCNSGRVAADLVVEGDIHYLNEKGESTDSGPGSRPRYLRGLHYWVLNPVFSQSRHNLAERQGLFICFGGSDPGEISTAITALAAWLPIELPVTLVLGSSFAGDVNIPENWSLRRGLAVEEISRLMSSMQVGIISGGVMMYEAACVGLPCALVIQNQGQEPGSQAFDRRGVHRYLGYAGQVNMERLAAACCQLMDESERRAKRGMALVDGAGAERIVHCIKEELNAI